MIPFLMQPLLITLCLSQSVAYYNVLRENEKKSLLLLLIDSSAVSLLEKKKNIAIWSFLWSQNICILTIGRLKDLYQLSIVSRY